MAFSCYLSLVGDISLRLSLPFVTLTLFKSARAQARYLVECSSVWDCDVFS